MTELLLPLSAYCVDPAIAVDGADILAWTDEFGLVKSSRMKQILVTTQVAEFADLAYPFADRAERLLADRWCLWTLLVDEFFEGLVETGTLGAEIPVTTSPYDALRAADTSPDRSGLDALCRALAELDRRTSTDMPADWSTAFRAHVAEFVSACHAESRQRVCQRPATTFAEFAALRRGSFATELFLDLVGKFERCLGALRAHAELLGGVRECAADIGGWCNDVLSYQREAAGNETANLVLFLAAAHDLAPAGAVTRARSMIDDRARQLLGHKAEAIARLRAGRPAEVAAVMRWITAVEALVSGSLAFQLRSARWQQG